MKFSIAIPAYKSKFLKECIGSILTQTYKNFELIIVNDASPEDIDSIVNGFKDERIHYYLNDDNIGAENVVDNWNKCLSFATGEYFVLMGDDDKIEPDYLEEFVKLIHKYPDLNVYHCRSYIINEKSERILLTQLPPEYESVYDNMWHRINFARNQYIGDFVYQRKSLLEQGGFYKLPLAWASDDISAYIAMKDKGIAHVNNPVFNYRKSDITLSLSGNFDLKMRAIFLEENWYSDFLKKNVPKLEKDLFLWGMINDRLKHYFIKKQCLTIATALNKNRLKIMIWYFKNRKKYRISLPMFIYSLIQQMKNSEV